MTSSKELEGKQKLRKLQKKKKKGYKRRKVIGGISMKRREEGFVDLEQQRSRR